MIWRPIDKYPQYEINSDGKVRIGDNELNQKTYNGYKYVHFMGRCFAVHRLVAGAFHPNTNKYPVVCHIDGTRSNNNKDNLYWGSYKDNTADARRHGTMIMGSKAHNAKLKEQDIKRIRSLGKTKTTREISEMFGIDGAHVINILKRWRWAHVA